MGESLAEFEASPAADRAVAPIAAGTPDPRYNFRPPEGGLVVRVCAKVLGGYGPPADQWERIFHESVSRDNLWITGDEHRALVRGEVPRSLQERIARFHLVDNTRGEPPMWEGKDLRSVSMALDDGRLTGTVRLATGDGQRGYEAELLGAVEVQDDRVVRFDVVALGDAWGEGTFTGGAPEGRFPLAVSFTLADGTDVADAIVPQGSRGWLPGYLRP